MRRDALCAASVVAIYSASDSPLRSVTCGTSIELSFSHHRGLAELSIANNAAAQACLDRAPVVSYARQCGSADRRQRALGAARSVGPLGQSGERYSKARAISTTPTGAPSSPTQAWFFQSNLAFRSNLRAVCTMRTDLDQPTCLQAAEFFFAVSSTNIAADIYRRSQHFPRAPASAQPPAPPTGLAAQVADPGATSSTSSGRLAPPPPLTGWRWCNHCSPPSTRAGRRRASAAGVPLGQAPSAGGRSTPLGTSGPSTCRCDRGEQRAVHDPAGTCITNGDAGGRRRSVTCPAVPGCDELRRRRGVSAGRIEPVQRQRWQRHLGIGCGASPKFRAFVRVRGQRMRHQRPITRGDPRLNRRSRLAAVMGPGATKQSDRQKGIREER